MALNLSIKNVPEALADRLRARAERNHRSLQGELMAIIENAVGGEQSSPGGRKLAVEAQERAEVGGREALRRGTKTFDEIAADLRAKYPEPRTDAPKSVDIIRELRDSR